MKLDDLFALLDAQKRPSDVFGDPTKNAPSEPESGVSDETEPKGSKQ